MGIVRVVMVVIDQAQPNTVDQMVFVGRSGTKFVLDGEPSSDPSTRSKVTQTFQDASQYGLTITRTWAFSDGGSRPLQISPGSYNEDMFKGLDFVISEAGKHGVRLILSLVNSWNDFGGKHQYVQWASDRGLYMKNDDDFYSHSIVKQYYKNHVKDDSSIFALELINEPRSQSDNCRRKIQEWVREMAAHVESIDGKHLLEVGMEGFYGETMPERKQYNPGYQVGTDFISNNQVPEIDFATIHLYPEQWLNASDEVQDAFVDNWVNFHIQDSNNVLKKPILIAEFGMSSTSQGYNVEKRDNYYRKLYNMIYNSAKSGGPCKGGIFWQLMIEEMKEMGDGYEVILAESPSTAKVILEQSQKLSSLT
ncbi:Mannan endo-1,4-beta-mannosidase [Quillaja saponaria]|uniref:mannan endo-1,4-beta-mannosidase n=1 Tax=Quillaja saponaria TaxID=32244 RepID=A0AAD7QAF7_QUISA|nr:Mannan endo-1,4-beta-mannosidase [Quillaja saponaria]